MLVSEFYNKYKNLPRHELEVLLLFVLKITKKEHFLNPNQEISSSQLAELNKCINLLTQNYPIAYIVNSKNFYGLDFYVDQNVLIPRPETEILVEQAIKLNPNSVLDIGTGSGCIAIAIARHLNNCQLTALDISTHALEVAKRNSQTHHCQINFIKSDFLQNIPKNSSFDLIITNPPYVKDSDLPFMSESTVLHEPDTALFAGPEGLDAYRQIFEQLKNKNISFEYFLGEFGFNQEKDMTDLLEMYFSGKYTLFKDLVGITRFLKINNFNAR